MTAFSGGGFFFPVRRRRPARAASAADAHRSGRDQVAHCEPTLKVPADARISEPYWHRKGEAGRYTFDADAPFGLPMRPTPFYVQVSLTLPGGGEVVSGLPVQHRYEGNIFSGEKRTELLVVPAFSVRVTPQIAIIPASAIRSTPTRRRATTTARSDGRGGQTSAAGSGRSGRSGTARPAPPPPPVSSAPTSEREIRVTVRQRHDRPRPTASVKLELPQGWTVAPAEQTVKFTRAGRSRRRSASR